MSICGYFIPRGDTVPHPAVCILSPEGTQCHVQLQLPLPRLSQLPGSARPARRGVSRGREAEAPRAPAVPWPSALAPGTPLPGPTETTKTTANRSLASSLLMSVFIHVSLPLLPW